MQVNYFFIPITSFLIGTIFIFLLKKSTLKYKALAPGGIPIIGGMSMGLSFVVVCLAGFYFYRSLSKEVIGILVSAVIMLVFGVIDDWRELSVKAKFLVQVIATVLLIFFGIRTYIVGIGSLFNIIITFIWILGITNAFNHLDIMDGLAAGTAVIVSLAFFIISILNTDIRTAILSLALIGAVFSFLIRNLPPAKTYMGNCGSHFLGFVLASVALIISYAPLERKIALISPLLILGLPIYDTAFVVLMRVRKKKLPFKKSNDHLVLRFVALGYSKKKALLIMLLLCIFFSLCGVLLSQVSNPVGIVIVAFVILASVILTVRMGKVAVDG